MNQFPTIPDSEIAKQAQAHVQALLSPAMYHHSVRTFLLGDAVGQRQALKYDRELLFLAAIMHDLGFAEAVKGHERFEVTGADAAYKFGLENGLDEAKAEILWDAIALHTSVGISTRKRPEIALVTVAAAMDIGGIGAEQIDSEDIHQIMEAYPRLQLETVLPETIAAEVKRKGPRPYVLTWVAEAGRDACPGWRCPSFMDVLRSNPFNVAGSGGQEIRQN